MDVLPVKLFINKQRVSMLHNRSPKDATCSIFLSISIGNHKQLHLYGRFLNDTC